MNKLCAFLVLGVVMFTSSCKKDVVEINSKTYLVSSITTTYPSGSTELKFIYDDSNRITDLVYGDGAYKYTYNSAGKLAKLAVTLNGVGLHHTLEYEYSASAIVLKENLIAAGRVNIFNGELTAGQVTRLNVDAKNAYIFTYDAKGNLLTYNEISDGKPYERATYTYDDKKSPFSMVVGYDSYLFFDSFIQAYSASNNRVSTKAPGTETIVYTYNEAGFPVSGVITAANGSVSNVVYKYIVK